MTIWKFIGTRRSWKRKRNCYRPRYRLNVECTSATVMYYEEKRRENSNTANETKDGEKGA